MKKILDILNSKYFLTTVITLSILVIIVGVVMVKKANDEAVVYVEQQKSKAIQQPISQNKESSSADVVSQLEKLAASAQAELEASKSGNSQPPQNMDFIPEASKQRVAAMVDKHPEVGSEDWCELLMAKPGEDWSRQDHSDFAKHCLD